MKFTWLLAVLSVACGGVVAPVPGSDDLGVVDPVDVPSVDVDAGEAAAPEPRFVCQLSTAAAYWTLDCTTLPDGGPSYLDTTGGIDCRDYEKGAGQGCVPGMSCESEVDGEMVQGTCIEKP